jgi:hypothetical protein
MHITRTVVDRYRAYMTVISRNVLGIHTWIGTIHLAVQKYSSHDSRPTDGWMDRSWHALYAWCTALYKADMSGQVVLIYSHRHMHIRGRLRYSVRYPNYSRIKPDAGR